MTLGFTDWTNGDRLTLFRAENIARLDLRETTMRPALHWVLASAFLAMASVADAGPFEDGQAAYDRHDYSGALQVWRPLADDGDAKVQNKLGNMYANGQGVAQDYAEAVAWFRKAADQGYANAQANLGSAYANGNGVPRDYAEALKRLRKSADQGFFGGQYYLGAMYEQGRGVAQDYVEAAQWYRLAADQGYPAAQARLGYMYAYGQGVAQDYAEAVAWFRKAADQGFADAQFALGYMYENGQGATRDYAEAVRWYGAAAKQGNARGEYRLGLMYSQGQGVPKDDAKAMQWFRLAAGQGNADAHAKLPPAPPPATPNPGTNQPSDRSFLDCASTGGHGEYTRKDYLRDATGLTYDQLEYMTEIISMMNCGQSFSRYTLRDFKCDPRFKGLSLVQAGVIARVLSIATCGQLPVNSMPPERRPKIMMDMGGGLLMEMPN